jgi:hypothetical protein
MKAGEAAIEVEGWGCGPSAAASVVGKPSSQTEICSAILKIDTLEAAL